MHASHSAALASAAPYQLCFWQRQLGLAFQAVLHNFSAANAGCPLGALSSHLHYLTSGPCTQRKEKFALTSQFSYAVIIAYFFLLISKLSCTTLPLTSSGLQLSCCNTHARYFRAVLTTFEKYCQRDDLVIVVTLTGGRLPDQLEGRLPWATRLFLSAVLALLD